MLTFLEAKMPVPEEGQARGSAIARVAVVANRMPSFIDLMQRTHEQWKDLQEGGE